MVPNLHTHCEITSVSNHKLYACFQLLITALKISVNTDTAPIALTASLAGVTEGTLVATVIQVRIVTTVLHSIYQLNKKQTLKF